jgi:hypothetical protein
MMSDFGSLKGQVVRASNGVCVAVSLDLRDKMILGSIFENGLIPQITYLGL